MLTPNREAAYFANVRSYVAQSTPMCVLLCACVVQCQGGVAQQE